eukprot:gene27098-2322_t
MGKVAKNFYDKTPSIFKKFFASPQCERLVRTFILYFASAFIIDWIIKAMEKARKQHVEGYNPYMAVARMKELEEETKSLKVEISQAYSMLILKYSNYEKPQQDKAFFESLYETLIAAMDEAFPRMNKHQEIEEEIGLMFRSRHFNMYERKNKPASVKELYATKNESNNRILNARMLASLFEKPTSTGITVASVTNSPLVSGYISSPVVSRALMKDPEARENMFKEQKKLMERNTERKAGTTPNATGVRKNIGAVFRSTALLNGVDTSKLAENLQTMSMGESAKAELGMVDKEHAVTQRSRALPKGAIAPEAAGLPVDESYNYLAFMKRYIIHGPGMGLAQPGGRETPAGGSGAEGAAA